MNSRDTACATGYPSLKNEFEVRADERLDDLQNNVMKLLQKKHGFRFGMDSVLLKDFVRIKPGEHVADLGTGSAVLPILLSQKENSAFFHAFEWQPELADMAARSVRGNQLDGRIAIHCADLRDAAQMIGKASVHAVVCNPPYGKKDNILESPNENKRLSRQETTCTIDEILYSCASILKNLGRLYMVFPSQRLLELLDSMRRYKLEPKRLRMVCGKASKAPYLFLVEGIKNAKPMLHWLPPLIVYHEDGAETEELKQIYRAE